MLQLPKKSGKLRPLGLATWSDKLVAEVVRLLLEAYYDVRFSDRSHGFRPGRGCYTALSEVVNLWKGTHWFVEGDIFDCFGGLEHQVMLSILAERIRDGRFLRLIGQMLEAGYLEERRAVHRRLALREPSHRPGSGRALEEHLQKAHDLDEGRAMGCEEPHHDDRCFCNYCGSPMEHVWRERYPTWQGGGTIPLRHAGGARCTGDPSHVEEQVNGPLRTPPE